jgi:rfaE bifunctional protein nucleotidyltransferase chain/domain
MAALSGMPSEKIKSVDDLMSLLRVARACGKRIVLANGCFDLIHVGHIRYLEGARKLGDILIVAVNSDQSVRNLKGAGRPVQDERDRTEMLASFACVDYVVIFDDPTVDGLLRVLRPDIHAKGTDYSEYSVPERQTVLAYGGKTAIVGDPKSHSSQDLLAQILRKCRGA